MSGQWGPRFIPSDDRAWEMVADELADRHEADARRDDELADLRAELERHGR